ncbi:hypothetical protein COHA_004565 [Chlorella ohadii]|uniref:Ionotropic glutamate receptor C-terminal domain-containing protein n=1 Tax=Chlorella ohadii TaxID=2649997 RepID=A0AAD5H5J5_9CHLO|nr:hypothetical protein COHA_004565 [Chlorella ohadii]
MSATEDALSAGVMFSDFPSTCSGIAVLTRARLQQSSIWFFLQPLAWGVWVLWLGLTAALIILMWLADVSYADDRSQYAQGWRGFGDAAFVTSTMSFTRAGANRFDHGTLAARLLGLFAAFFFMIFFTIYTAQLAGRLAVSSLQSSFASLRTGDFAVVYPRNLAWAAASAHIAGVPIDNWEDPAVRDAAFWLMDNAAHPSGQPPPTVQAALDSGAFSREVPDALLILLSQARLAAAQYCNLFIVGEQIQTTKQALAFPAAAPNITRRAFSIAENRLQEAESFFDASRTEAFLLTVNATDFHPARCPGKLPVSSSLLGQGGSSGSQDQIQVNQILGLLVVLGVGMAASGLLMLWGCRSRRKRQWLRRHARAMLLPLWTCCGRQAGGKTAPAPEAPAPAGSDT